MADNKRWGIDFGPGRWDEGEPSSPWARIRRAAAGFLDAFRASPTGWRCSRCGGTESMFESMDPEDPTVEICKGCGYKQRY